MSNLFTIALPSGRMSEESLDFFRRSGFADFQIPETRELSFVDPTGRYRILLVRNQDVPVCVLHGGADAGVTGRDVMEEKQYDLAIPLELEFGYCRLSLAARSEDVDRIKTASHLRVATKYPSLTQDWFFKRGKSCEIVHLNGSVEIAPIVGLSDCIVDLVSTGTTLRANGLTEIEQIMESRAMLVVNRSVFALHTEEIRRLILTFRKAMEDGRQAHTS